MRDGAKVCARPFCDGPCDAGLHEIPDALQAIIGALGTACPSCKSTGFGFASEYRMDERPVQFLVLWHADICPSLVYGGYIIANLPQTALKTGDVICEALGQITDQDIRESDAGMSWPEIQARLQRGERWPAHLVETARLIAEREARQAR